MRTATEIIGEMDMVIGKQKELSQTLARLSKELENLDKENWEWVTVRKASEVTGLSQAYLYNRINQGKLETRRVSAKIFVNLEELRRINDVA